MPYVIEFVLRLDFDTLRVFSANCEMYSVMRRWINKAAAGNTKVVSFFLLKEILSKHLKVETSGEELDVLAKYGQN